MAATRKANLGLYEGWADNEDGWGEGMSENLRFLDLLVMPRVLSMGSNSPPGSPADGDAYIVGASGSGAWATHDNEIARYNGAVWEFVAPKSGWTLYVVDAGRPYQYSGSTWVGAEVFDSYTYCMGSPGVSATMLRVPIVRAVLFPANFVGSQGSAGTVCTGSTVFTIKKNGTTVGTATFAAGTDDVTFATSGGVAVAFAAGDILSIHAPASPDPTLADIGFGITGIR